MLLHDVEFLVSELSRLFQDAVFHTDFAYVVEEGGDAQAIQLLGIHFQ